MHYHLNGLKQYISLKDSIDNIIHNMTMKIFEVEDDIVTSTLHELLVIGYVTAVTQHPNADKLKVCQVDCGNHGQFQICTGGENVAEGHYVPVALPGCYLSAIDMHIKPRPMRGEESNGMICSKGELGIDEDEDKHWIWLLDEDMDDLSAEDKGKSMGEKYPWLENTQFEVKNIAITTRPDLTGYWGVACELNAVYHGSGLIGLNNVPVMLEDIRNTDVTQALDVAPNSSKGVRIDTNGCACYSLIEIADISVKPSDLYHRVMVYGTGAIPRNNWVDWSNNYMNLTGQPVHCFDRDKVVGDIIIRDAQDGEEMIDLLGAQHALQSGDIVICDSEKIIALAGVIGGVNSCISNETTNILIEVAQFDPTQVRKTATRLGLRTDAAVRYEKYINPRWTQYCAMMVPEQMRKHAKSLGSSRYVGITHEIATMPSRTPVQVSISKAQQFIRGDGNAYTGEQMSKLMSNLGFVVSIHDDVMICMPPIWRSPADITHVQDIYEEIARIVGYENLGTQTLKTSATPQLNPMPAIVRKLEDTMVLKYGYDQVESYLWTEEKYLKLLGQNHDDAYTLLNPLSPEQTIIRPALYPGLIKTVVQNHRIQDTIHIFEIAHVVDHEGNENNHLCIISYISKDKNVLQDAIISHKSMVSDIVGQYHIIATDKSFLHPTKQGKIMFNQGAGPAGNPREGGLIGQVHPLVCDELGLNIDYQLVVTELDITALIAQGWTGDKNTTSYLTNQHHIITRDASFGITGDATYEQVISIAQAGKGIQNVEVFDMYQPSEELKTIGIRFTMVYEDAPSTESVTKKVDYVVSQIAKLEGVSVR